MTIEEKTREIKSLLKKGVPKAGIKESLKQEGFSQEEIDFFLKPSSKDLRFWYLLIALITLGGGIYVYIKTGFYLLLLISAFFFVTYYAEIKRINRLKKNFNQ
ncbi:MAG: hypothetical protein ACHQEB_00295 [Chitinophagales bacterium]